MNRRRMMLRNAEQNIFVTGNAGSVSTVIAEVLEGNILSLTSFPKTTESGRVYMKFKYPISVEQGDVFRIVCTKQSGSVNNTSVRVGINTFFTQASGQYVDLNTGFTLDYTVTANASYTQIFLHNSSTTIRGTNYKALFEIYKNGVKII